MATKDVPDALVCQAYQKYAAERDAAMPPKRDPIEVLAEYGHFLLTGMTPKQPPEHGRAVRWPYKILAEWTGQPEKVCYRAMERAESHGLVECGTSLRSGWLTDAGIQLIRGQT